MLKNISILRPFIVLLIVVNHCFAIYSGAWPSPWDFQPDIPTYKWIQRIAICCTLQLFTFISGYVYAYQYDACKYRNFKELVVKKLQRLIIPCATFGAFYYCLVTPFKDITISSFLVNMNNGMGHLWFLPMLFWCFILIFLLDRKNICKRINVWILLLISFAISVASSYIPDYVGLSKACQYFVYFFFGVLCWRRSVFNPKFRLTNPNVESMIAIVLYAVLFIIYYYIIDNKEEILVTTISLLFYKVLEFATRIFGILTFMLIATLLVDNMKRVPDSIIYIGKMGFGVYIFHQILIDIVYYKTNLPEFTGDVFLPLVMLPISIIVSLVTTHFLKLTKVGKQLL